MVREGIIRDPVYGSFRIDKGIQKILDLPFMRRLNNIKQLSFSFFQFLGATHTRLLHSVGVLHLARKVLESLKYRSLLGVTNEDIKVAMLVGLFHDIGHGPFSHSLSLLLNQIVEEERVKDEKFDVMQTRQYLEEEQYREEILNYCKEEHYQRVKRILCSELKELRGKNRFIKGMIDSGADIDRIDYLTRDAYFTGIGGSLDVPSLVENMIPLKGGEEKIYFGYSFDGLEDLENLLTLRNKMYSKVYEREKRVAADLMFTHSVYAYIWGKRIQAREKALDLAKMTDPEVITLLKNHEKRYIKLLATMLHQQRTINTAFSKSFYDILHPNKDSPFQRKLKEGIISALRRQEWGRHFTRMYKKEQILTERIVGKEKMKNSLLDGEYPAVFLYITTRKDVRAATQKSLQQPFEENNKRVLFPRIYLAEAPNKEAITFEELIPYYEYLSDALLKRVYFYLFFLPNSRTSFRVNKENIRAEFKKWVKNGGLMG